MTLAVADLDATRRFYVEGLGWQPELDVPGEVLMFRTGEHLVLSLWERSHFAAEVGEPTMSGIAPITLAHNLATKEAVDTVLATARRAGADPVADAGRARMGWLHRLLRRPRRLPVGDRLQPRADRPAGPSRLTRSRGRVTGARDARAFERVLG